MGWKDEINKEFKNCLKLFPEIKTIEFILEECEDLAGIGGSYETRDVIILLVPQVLQDMPKALRPIILHELSHVISKGSEECERVFNERADKWSKELYTKLKEINAFECEDTRS